MIQTKSIRLKINLTNGEHPEEHFFKYFVIKYFILLYTKIRKISQYNITFKICEKIILDYSKKYCQRRVTYEPSLSKNANVIRIVRKGEVPFFI